MYTSENIHYWQYRNIIEKNGLFETKDFISNFNINTCTTFLYCLKKATKLEQNCSDDKAKRSNPEH